MVCFSGFLESSHGGRVHTETALDPLHFLPSLSLHIFRSSGKNLLPSNTFVLAFRSREVRCGDGIKISFAVPCVSVRRTVGNTGGNIAINV